MPRTYKKKIGGRTYQNYTPEKLQEAIKNIQKNGLSLRDAQNKYNIHRNTLYNKIKGKHTVNTPGRPTIFTPHEENEFVKHAISMSGYGFPITPFELRCIIRSYLNKMGKKVPIFKDNLPGADWVKSFIKRHQTVLSHRFAKNIKNARAAIDENVVNAFFDHLDSELKNVVPAINIWNYDETNLVDDPGSKKVIVRRGCKYPEVIRNSTKACTSIMVCGNAAGDVAPVYVNYKSQKLWQTWVEGGPDGARYNCSKSGWFDTQSFEDWFMNLMLPILKKQEGKKVIIGDNLSSHLNIEVVKACEENNVSFVCLPPNATHLFQPLDVAYFRPMKVYWRKILADWKETNHGSRCATIPKDCFPRLLKKLFDVLEPSNKENLKSGFRKCGLSPINRNVVLDRLPKNVLEESLKQVGAVSESFVDFLKTRREDQTTVKTRQKRKAINVVPGKSVSSKDLEDYEQPSTSKGTSKKNTSGKKRRRERISITSVSSSENGDEYSLRESSCSPYSDIEDIENMLPFLSQSGTLNNLLEGNASSSKEEAVQAETRYKEGEYVIVKYDAKYYPGQITAIDKKSFLICTMTKGNKFWKWPEKKDEIWYTDDMVVKKINEPKLVTKRGHYDVPELHDDVSD